MCRRLVFLVCFVLVVGLANGASAEDVVWTGAAADNNSWCNDDNWDPDNDPGSGNTAVIGPESPDRGPIIGIGCDVSVTNIKGPDPAGPNDQVMDVNTSGTVNVGSWLWRDGEGTATININGSPTITIGGAYWRGPDKGVGILNIDDDAEVIVDANLRGADETGSFYVNMTGGRLECGVSLVFGDVGGGEINLSGGSIILGDSLLLGGLRGVEPITVNVTGGLLRVGREFQLPSNAGRAGVVSVNLDAGIIDCNEFVHGGETDSGNPTYTDDWHLDIEQGELRIWGDVRAAIDANIAAGQITGYDDNGTVKVEFIDGNTVVTGVPPDPNCASHPYPSNWAKNVDLDVVLSWTPGTNAASHNVYFGTDFEDVNNGTGGTFRANKQLDANEYDPCDHDPCGLDYLTTYYWRIDEVNDGNTWTGRVWRFTTGSSIVDPNLLLWYKFDESKGSIAADSSGRGYDGMVDGNEILWDPCNGHDGGSRIFDNKGEEETVVQVPSAVLSDINEGITFSVWLKDSYRDGDDNWVFDTGAGGETGPFHVQALVVTKDKEDVKWRAGNDTNDVLRWNLDGRNPGSLEGWRHWAFVKDENQGKMYIYFDGGLVREKSDTRNSLVNVQDTAFKIGAATWSQNWDYVGKMDDFRVYDYAMSAPEIAELFRGEKVELAWGPEPGDFEVDVPRDANLVWKPGSYTVSHDVYFGTDFVDVSEANNSWPEDISVYKGNQELCEYNMPGLLEFETTYYWRIDEVNGPCTWPGPVWRFKTVNYFVVDDFELYNKTTNQIHNTWRDYQWQTVNNWETATGALLGLGVDPYDEVHTGEQSMTYIYLNYPCSQMWCPPGCGDIPPGYGILGAPYAMVYYSEASLPIPTEEQDWTREGVKLLRLYFYGDADNDTNDSEQMYVGVKDGDDNYAEVRYGEYNSEEQDMNDFKIDEWQKWDVALSHFSDSNFASVVNDVNLANIAELYIGFGDKEHPLDIGNCGGQGIVVFDDIRLYLPICNPKYGPAADFSGDCVVDIVDVGIMGEHWLLTDANFGSAIEKPNDANLAGWWKMDDGSGNTATDDSGYGNDGTIEGYYMWVTGRNDVNTALKFRHSGGWVLVPDDGNTPELRPLHQVSACAWVYYPESQDQSARVVVKGADNKETFDLEVHDDDEFVFLVRDANKLDDDGDYESYDVNGSVWPGSWIHLAGTYDGWSVKCYINGQLVDSRDDANDPNFLLSQDTSGLGIGNRSDANDKEFMGTVDDVRVYDYSLSAAEVAWLASDGTGYVGLAVPFNLYDEESVNLKAINFKDFAMLMESWLDEKLWPQ